jgi:hypothetical protein
MVMQSLRTCRVSNSRQNKGDCCKQYQMFLNNTNGCMSSAKMRQICLKIKRRFRLLLL